MSRSQFRSDLSTIELIVDRGSFREGGHRVPTMIRWLGRVEPNSVNTKILSSLDLFPTIGALAGYSLQPSVSYDGVDVTAALFTAAPSPRTTFFFHSVSNVLCDGAVVSSSDDDIEIRAARGEVFDATSHWPNRIGGDMAPPTPCNYTLNVGIATPTVGGNLHPPNNYYASRFTISYFTALIGNF